MASVSINVTWAIPRAVNSARNAAAIFASISSAITSAARAASLNVSAPNPGPTSMTRPPPSCAAAAIAMRSSIKKFCPRDFEGRMRYCAQILFRSATK